MFKKREESDIGIGRAYNYGPVFGGADICVFDYDEDNDGDCLIGNNGEEGFECHPEYKTSLFVNTDGPDESNVLWVLDYEVYEEN